MSGVYIEIIIIFFLILINGIFSMSEIAVLSARKVRLQQRSEDGDVAARSALQLAESPNRFLSTVQVGITLIGILSGALGGATLSDPLAAWISQTFPVLGPSSHELAVALVVLAITYFSLVLGELVPKRLALSDPERLAGIFAGPMKLLSKLTFPLVQVLTVSTDAMMRLLRVQVSDDPPVTEDEIKVLMEQGTQVGVFEQAETSMVEGVFRLGGRLVGALMTPRTEIEWLDLEDDLETNLTKVINSVHEHFPVAEGNLDAVQGVLRAKELLAGLRDGTPDLRELALPALFVPESTPALKLLEQLRSGSGNLALVMDEYGGLLGMVTLFDVMEAIVGDISTGGVPSEPMATLREDGSWLVDGTMPVDQFKDLLDLDELPEEQRVGFQTVAGYMLAQIGAIPRPGDHFEWSGWRFEVMDMDGLRVDKILAGKEKNLQGEEKG
jgi:putative hemolysin